MALDARPAAGLPSGDGLAVPRIPVSAGAMVFDRSGRLLILKPTYKSGWTIPGGVMEADGETPWDACRREVREECGLDLQAGRLACVDFRRPRPERPGRPGNPGGIRFLFDCGRLDDENCAAAGTEIPVPRPGAHADLARYISDIKFTFFQQIYIFTVTNTQVTLT